MGFETADEGTKSADGTEQTLIDFSDVARLSGYISLSEMQAGDTVVIRQYAKLFSTYDKYAEQSYSDAQDDPVVYITPKEICSALKVTVQQTAGTMRDYEYKFIKDTATITIKVGGASFRV